MMTAIPHRSIEEICNTATHLAGLLFLLSTSWILVVLGFRLGWSYAFGALFFLSGAVTMYLMSTLYHWTMPGRCKQVLRKLDHISIYIMIASSYTPICICVVGGWLGWLVFGLLWAMVIAGAFYKIFAFGRYPRLSLFLYLLMGWSVLLMIDPVYDRLSAFSIVSILLEGLFYCVGVYFFTRDRRIRFFHAIWHVFVLLGTVCHWACVLDILLGAGQ